MNWYDIKGSGIKYSSLIPKNIHAFIGQDIWNEFHRFFYVDNDKRDRALLLSEIIAGRRKSLMEKNSYNEVYDTHYKRL